MTVATALPQEAAPSPQSLRVLQERAAAQRPGWLYYAGWAAALAFLGWAWKGAEIRPLDLVRDSGNIATYLSDFFPPDFRDWRIYMGEMLVTLHIEGIRATGAHPLVEIVYGVIPQVLPLWVSFTLYRFESNVRSASVVGMVGAGGIGVVLFEVIRGFQYAQTCAVLIILVVSVSLIDLLSARLRRRFI
jgi:ABC-type phosphate/phosphonate transport system permease subunit